MLNGKTLIVAVMAGLVLYRFRYRLLNEILKREAVQKRVVQWGMCQGRLFFSQNRRFKIPQKDLIDPSVFLVGAFFPAIDSFPPLG
ncbi:hypothetical protein, partial [Anoxybacillus flavithermus]|uniref:hypothetical protein n=1 Tax=Anoxybacillus flavithermus TaxID=33934 RepID=UPI0019D5540C